jgi:hypothetical protein
MCEAYGVETRYCNVWLSGSHLSPTPRSCECLHVGLLKVSKHISTYNNSDTFGPSVFRLSELAGLCDTGVTVQSGCNLYKHLLTQQLQTMAQQLAHMSSSQDPGQAFKA